jgi:hypothetical protein
VRFDLTQTYHPHHSQLYFTLTVDPWLSGESLARIFRQLQSCLLGYAQNRPPTESNLRMFDFVSERLEQPNPGSWPDIARAWNKKLPKDERYTEKTFKNIQRDYERVYRQVMFMASARVGNKEA